MQFMKSYLKEKTVLLVTHNSDELSLIDTVYQIRQGRLVKRD